MSGIASAGVHCMRAPFISDYRRPRAARLLFGALAVVCGTAFGAQRCEVPAELWDKPRSGRALISQPVLKTCMAEAAREASARVVIHHGNRGETPLQAEELRGWLAALAIDPARVELLNDLGQGDQIVLEVGGR
jgi:hypothetical protein